MIKCIVRSFLLVLPLLALNPLVLAQTRQGEAIEFDIPVLPQAQRYINLLEYPSYVAVALENVGLNPSYSARLTLVDARQLRLRNAMLRYAGSKGSTYTYRAGVIVDLRVSPTEITFPVELDTSKLAAGTLNVRLFLPLAKLLPEKLVERLRTKAHLMSDVAAQKKLLDYLDGISERLPAGAGWSGLFDQIMLDAYNRASGSTLPVGREGSVEESLPGQLLMLLILLLLLVIVPLVWVIRYFWRRCPSTTAQRAPTTDLQGETVLDVNHEPGRFMLRAAAKPLRHPNPVLIVLALIIFISIFIKGWALGLDQGASNRIRFHAIPVALAATVHGLPHDYTSRITIAHRFQNETTPLNEVIAAGKSAKISSDDQVYFWPADDRGMADYVIAAFKLFGYKERSLYLFYFVLLGLSCAVCIVAYKHDTRALAILALALVAIWTFLPVLPLASEGSFLSVGAVADSGDHVALFETRIFDVLAFVAVLHIALFVFKQVRPSFLAVGSLVIQTFFFFFLYHARSSLGWMLVAIIALISFAVFRGMRHHDGLSLGERLGPPAIASVVILLMASALGGYKQLTYHPRYLGELGARTFWHNALMGLGADKGFKETYRLDINDRLIIEAVIWYVKTIKGIELPPEWNADHILFSLGSHTDFDWKTYETYARQFYFYIWEKHTLRTLRTYVVMKPAKAFSIVLSSAMPNPKKRAVEVYRKVHGLYLNPLSGGALLFAVIPLLFLFRHYRETNGETLIVTILLICSLIPSISFYASIMTMAGTFLTISLLTYLLIPKVLTLVWTKYFTAP